MRSPTNQYVFIAVALACQALAPTTSEAWSRRAKFPNGTNAVYKMNETQWTPREVAGVRKNIIDSANTWNAVGGVNLQLSFGGASTASELSNDGTNMVSHVPCGYSPCTVSAEWFGFESGGIISGFDIILYSQNGDGSNHRLFSPRITEGWDIQGAMVHEFGHAIGFNHSSVSGSIMNSGSFANKLLGEDDLQGLRTDATFAYPMQTASLGRFLYSTDGATWTLGSSLQASTVRPSVVYGADSGSTNYLVALTNSDTTNTIRVLKGNGVTWSSNTALSSTSPFTASLGYNPDTGLIGLAFTEAASTRRIFTRDSTDGVTWSSAVERVSVKSQGGPALHYADSPNLWILAWTDAATMQVYYKVGAALSSLGSTRSIGYTSFSHDAPAVACRRDTNLCTFAFASASNEGMVTYLEGPIGTSAGFEPIRINHVPGMPTTGAAPALAWRGPGGSDRPWLLIGWQGTNTGRSAYASRRGSTDEWADWLFSVDASFPSGQQDGLLMGISMSRSEYFDEFASVFSR